MPIGAILAGIGTALNLVQQSKLRQEARRKNKEQQRLDALINLISVAQGDRIRRVNAPPVLPQVDYGGAVSDIGGLIDQYQKSKEADLKQKKLDDTAKEKEKALMKLRNISSGGDDPFSAYKF